MGYSCNKDSADSMAVICHMFGKPNTGNTLILKGTEYFFERGRENQDGAITGSLMRMLPGGYCRKAGTYRIDPDGTVSRFPGMTAAERQEVVDTMRDMQARNPHLLSAWGFRYNPRVTSQTL